MDPDQPHDPKGQFDAALPLPPKRASEQKAVEPEIVKESAHAKPSAAEHKKLAADIIRQKVEAAYAGEPSLQGEIEEVEQAKPSQHLSKHQQHIQQLVDSGQSMADIQTAWHEYYENLSDKQKHEVWKEFYDANAKAQQAQRQLEEKAAKASATEHETPRAHEQSKASPKPRPARASKPARKKPLHSLMFGLAAGGIAVMIVLFSFFNERFIAPFIQPSRTVTNTPLISDASAVGSSPEIVIPKINVEIPVVYGVDTIDEAAVEQALESGVVHYADTAMPGQNGNGVIVGHSSNNIFNKGKYKFAFVLLSRLDVGDVFYLQKDGKRYTYQVYKKEVVNPADVSVLGAQDKPATVTLITCDPPGTSLNRLVIVAEQISPEPSGNTAASGGNDLAKQTKTVPGNSPSLWSRLTGWISH